jgi:hypothetical protein
MALKAKYRGVPMPNLKLSDDDVAEVVDFIAAETKRQRASLAPPKSRSPRRIIH